MFQSAGRWAGCFLFASRAANVCEICEVFGVWVVGTVSNFTNIFFKSGWRLLINYSIRWSVLFQSSLNQIPWEQPQLFDVVCPKKTQHFTLPETNITPDNGWLEDAFPFGMSIFARVSDLEKTPTCRLPLEFRGARRTVPSHLNHHTPRGAVGWKARMHRWKVHRVMDGNFEKHKFRRFRDMFGGEIFGD